MISLLYYALFTLQPMMSLSSLSDVAQLYLRCHNIGKHVDSTENSYQVIAA